MRRLHVQNRVLQILEMNRLTGSAPLEKDVLLVHAILDTRIRLHYPILSFIRRNRKSKEIYLNKIEEAIDALIAPYHGPYESGREMMAHQEKYFARAASLGINPQIVLTERGQKFIDWGGFMNELWHQYEGAGKIIAALISGGFITYFYGLLKSNIGF